MRSLVWLFLAVAVSACVNAVGSRPRDPLILQGDADSPIEFYCFPHSPCAIVYVDSSPVDASGYDLQVWSEVYGGVDVRAERLRDVNPDRVHMQDQDGWSLGGFGFNKGGPQRFGRDLPAGTAEHWIFTFLPSSGPYEGFIRFTVAWREPG